MKILFDKIDESLFMQIEKEYSLNPLSFFRIEDYFGRVKEL
jgi:hypothetical protein